MRYVLYYADLGSPIEDLAPVIDIFIKVSDGLSAGVAPTVNQFAGKGGFYYFDYSPTEDIAIRVDSNDATMADRDRYIALVASPHDEALSMILQVEAGRWRIVANQMIFYDTDGVTPLYTFNLKDASGNATMTDVMEREPV